jgi:Cys-tRNA synthase (O-phospho-L-seryl-tRNA:Cys-tRNA synthase)
VLKPSIYNLEGVDEGPDYAGQPMLKVHPDADYGSIGETTSLTIYTKNNQIPLLVDNIYLVVLKDVELFRHQYWLEANKL